MLTTTYKGVWSIIGVIGLINVYSLNVSEPRQHVIFQGRVQGSFIKRERNVNVSLEHAQ